MFSFFFGDYALVFDLYHVCFFGVAVVAIILSLILGFRLSRVRKSMQEHFVAETHLLKGEVEVGALKLQSVEQAYHRDAQLWAAEKQELLAQNSKADQYRTHAENVSRKLAGLEATQQEREKAFAAERSTMKALNAEIHQKFQQLADSALRQSQKQFLEIANEQMRQHKEVSQADLARMIGPIKESFSQFSQKVENIEKVRNEDRSSLRTEIEKLSQVMVETQNVTGKLANALSAPKSGGRWGEETLRNVLEMAGLSEHADFSEQVHANVEDGANIRPDVVVRMPGGRHLVIDSKVSVDDFLQAADESDVQRQNMLLQTHARKMRDHVTTLARKAYWAQLPDTVDFVAMFVPGENFYAAALSSDRDLFDYAARNKVIIVTPSTLVALAKAVAFGWRQESAAQNTKEVTDLARELYSRISILGDKVLKMGRHLSGASSAYNEMVGTLETKVLPQARKFDALGVSAEGKSIPDLEDIEDNVREPVRGRDLVFKSTESADIPDRITSDNSNIV
ncbi:DNA recombination protein RmuC [Hirschia litorea]|uniref:DNA recombination protein RmuC homolog n=1 Tax=Hirschia litorea TaxID=1199156 RepID=A0ABW2IJZ5_9PROT